MNSKNTYPINSIFLAGPTATGKTALAIALAKRLQAEVITVDSAQVYRGMDIGTAKPNKSEMAGVRHHLIDVHDVTCPFNVAEFIAHVESILEDMKKRDVFPIFAGGTGLYFQALLEGLPTTPPANATVRARLEILETKELYQILQKKDPEYAGSITVNDRHKILRANEILVTTQKRVSAFQKKTKPLHCSQLNPKCYFIYRPRPIIYERLNIRAKHMCENGLLQEVEVLRAKGIESNLNAKKAIAYQQPLQYLKGELTYEKMLEKLQQANRNYAKRQFTWFKRLPAFTSVDLETLTTEEFLEVCLKDLGLYSKNF